MYRDQSRDPAAVETSVIMSGNSTAVRIPKQFGIHGRVMLRRLPRGRVLIEPVTKRSWPTGFLASFDRLTPDFTVDRVEQSTERDEARAERLFDPRRDE